MWAHKWRSAHDLQYRSDRSTRLHAMTGWLAWMARQEGLVRYFANAMLGGDEVCRDRHTSRGCDPRGRLLLAFTLPRSGFLLSLVAFLLSPSLSSPLLWLSHSPSPLLSPSPSPLLSFSFSLLLIFVFTLPYNVLYACRPHQVAVSLHHERGTQTW